MRLPAAAAGLAELQRFLETGFDTFAAMATRGACPSNFLKLIQTRETNLISALFTPDFCVARAIDEGLLPDDAK